VVQLKVEVNGRDYEIEIIGNKARVNGKEVDLELKEEEITVDGTKFHLDFLLEGEPSLMIINGMTFLVSKGSLGNASVKELKAPINGQITDVLVLPASQVKKGQILVILEAMKMENQIKSPVNGRIKEVRVVKGQAVKMGETVVTFE
jgi:biotin carboxyl carrier protein